MYLQTMDIAHHSLPKGLIFIAQMILGVAIALVGISLSIWGLDFFGAPMFLVPIIAGFIAGYILKKHFFWALSWGPADTHRLSHCSTTIWGSRSRCIRGDRLWPHVHDHDGSSHLLGCPFWLLDIKTCQCKASSHSVTNV